MEETVIEPEKAATDKKDDGSVYVDCIRLVEGGQIRRFETLVTKFDLVEYELSHDLSKPILFHAIEHNDDAFVKILLEMEVPLNRSYSVRRHFDGRLALHCSSFLPRSWYQQPRFRMLH